MGTRDMLPLLGTETADVTFEALWWWGRLTRWDVACRLAPLVGSANVEGVLRDVRLETIVEVCRWDLDLAQYLARAWDGDPQSLTSTIKDQAAVPPLADPHDGGRRQAETTWPHADVAHLWDLGHLELWQNEHSPSPHALAALPAAIEHSVWAAQSRVLLPWIETKRQLLVRALIQRFGEAQVNTAADRSGQDQSPIEVGRLFSVVRALPTHNDAVWRDASRQLKSARNRLAHLQILNLTEQARLADSCGGLF
ncbi:hypothetical protein AB0H83_21705 [Dactylosporangium sp. NPDC050688]|uniref:hypothetical protein n=1 Tax=Dactylosporangium sp. NPDC050688 TaxID=3157217 RepID=UPI0033E7B552